MAIGGAGRQKHKFPAAILASASKGSWMLMTHNETAHDELASSEGLLNCGPALCAVLVEIDLGMRETY